jgi:hypothetical protein
MARKLCEFCNTRPSTSQNRGSISIQACEPCETEAGFENEHADGQCGGVEGGKCWICLPELNRAQATYVKPERKGHRSPRRPQINHRACSHAQTPSARRECRKAFWAAKAEQATEAPAAPVLHAAYIGLVEWDGARNKTHQGFIIRDLGAGKLLVRTNSKRPTPVRVAFSALRLPA